MRKDFVSSMLMTAMFFIGFFAFKDCNANESLNFGKKYQKCYDVKKIADELKHWTVKALSNNSSIGCPSDKELSLLSKLEAISMVEGECKDKAIGDVVAFYVIIDNLPNYRGCRLDKKFNIFKSALYKDGQVCKDEKVDEINKCFLLVNLIATQLKIDGDLSHAFNLAAKTANSNDVTGLSQLFLGIMYMFGEGCSKDITLAIHWLNEAIARLASDESRMKALLALGVAYEEVHDLTNAKSNFQRCAVMGDVTCKQAFARLNSMGH